MSTIGDKLKDARMAKGYTLDDLQEMTDIQKRYLQAIENNNEDILPGNFYAEAFIRQYAETVGLDGEVLVKEFRLKHDQNQSSQVEDSPVLSRSSSEKAGALETIKDSFPMILILGLILAIVIAIYIAGSQLNSSSTTINSDREDTIFIRNNSNQGENEEQEEMNGNVEASNSAIVQLEESDGTVTEFTVQNLEANPAHFTLEAEGGDSWVSIELDERLMDSGLIINGEEMRVEFNEVPNQGRLVIGNAPVTNVYLNNQPLEFPEETDGFVRQELLFSFE